MPKKKKKKKRISKKVPGAGAPLIPDEATSLPEVLERMRDTYLANPEAAVRGQSFIKQLHSFLAAGIVKRLSEKAVRGGIQVREEATLFGSHKPKDVDVSVIHPVNGPLMIIGLRSQMSSVGNNALTYYQDIIGECISLQERFPLATIGYIYLMPLRPILPGKERQIIDHARYAKMYSAITGRSGHDWKALRGVYDEFAYLVVDFNQTPPAVCDDLVATAVPHRDLRFSSFIDRMIDKYKERDLFLDYFE